MNAYIPFHGFTDKLKVKLKNPQFLTPQLFLAESHQEPLYFAKSILYDIQKRPIESISSAANYLKQYPIKWAYIPNVEHRRGFLIQDKLPYTRSKPYQFMEPLPTSQMGAWTLLSRNSLMYSTKTSSSLPAGDIHFVEDLKIPSKAYLKLYEALTKLGSAPTHQDQCIEVGSSPGGWTYVLAHMAKHVFAFDRSPLDPILDTAKNITLELGDAFKKASPERVDQPIEWFFSDLAATPKKLYTLVSKWLDRGCQKFVCTLKLSEGLDEKEIDLYASIDNSVIVHLNHNKHELTWIKHPDLDNSTHLFHKK